MKLKCLSIIGARPQFIKAAPMSRELLRRSNEFQEIIVHTGQHFDKNMSDVFFTELNIPEPQYKLDIHGGSHGDMTARMLAALEKVMQTEQPDFVMVYGDTNSTIAGALAAAKLHIPVVHIEAGLRSFNKAMPEEVNRVLTDHVSKLLFCPTNLSAKNLALEGICENVFIVGDLMFDTVKMIDEALQKTINTVQQIIGSKNYLLLSMHRPGNVDNLARFKSLITYIEQFSTQHKLPIVFPIHPRTKYKMAEFDLKIRNCHYLEPLSYIEMQSALKNAQYLLTDSGGMQKEAYFHHVPCITLRDETEWVETIEAGWNRLWTSNDYQKPRCEITTYGTGMAAKEIANLIYTSFSKIAKTINIKQTALEQ